MTFIIIQIIQFLAGLSLIIGIHELGHLCFAKLFKMRVNSYIIGFPPKIFKIRWGETEYAIGAIPLGGAVQVAGMLDESLNKDHLTTPAQPWEFRSKPAWQRFIVILGGIIFNLISSMLMHIGLCYQIGTTYLSKDSVNKYGIMPNAIGNAMGFQPEDKIIKINGKDFESFYDVYAPNVLLCGKSYTICRAGKEINLPISEELINALLNKESKESVNFIRPLFPCIIASVQANSNASMAGLMPGDQITKVDSQAVYDYTQWAEIINTFLNKKVEITYIRNGSQQTVPLTIDAAKIDITPMLPAFSHIQKNYSLIQSISVGIQQTISTIQCQLIGIGKLITGKLSLKKSLGGPISIARMFDNTFIWHKFLTLVATLSIVIGLTNALPLLPLDGGHALLILYEILFRRKVSDSFVQRTQQVGIALLLLVMLYVCSNDIYKLIHY